MSMSLKGELTGDLEGYQDTGKKIDGTADTLIDEGKETKKAFGQIEAIDEDDKAALGTALDESGNIAEGLAESEIRGPWSDLDEEIGNLSDKAKEYQKTEMRDAAKASEAVGNYSGVGAKLSEDLTKSGEAFQEISSESDKTKSEFSTEFEKKSAELEDMW